MAQTIAKRQRNGPMTTYTPEKGIDICQRIAAGQTLRQIANVKGMPYVDTIRNWVLAFSDFREMYSAARIQQSHALFDEVIDHSHGMIDTAAREDGRIYKDRESAVAIRALQWAAGRLNPGTYGEHIPASVATSVSIHTTLDVNSKEAEPVVGGKTTYTIIAERKESAEEKRDRQVGENDGKKARKRPKARKPKQSRSASTGRSAGEAVPAGEGHDGQPTVEATGSDKG